MPSVTASSWLLYLGIINIAAFTAYIVFLQLRIRQRNRQVGLINAIILDHFRRSGVEVVVGSISLMNNKRFTALIESEPMKRFRLSHIIEMTLREHIAKTCGLALEKIYWRFPIKDAEPNGAASSDNNDKVPPKNADDYINEGLVPYRDLPKVDVSESSWEKFEEFSTKDPNHAVAAER